MINDLELSLLVSRAYLITNPLVIPAAWWGGCSHMGNKTDFTDLEEDLAQEIEVVNWRGVLEANSWEVKRSNEGKTGSVMCTDSKLLELCKMTGIGESNGRVQRGGGDGGGTTSRDGTIEWQCFRGTPMS